MKMKKRFMVLSLMMLMLFFSSAASFSLAQNVIPNVPELEINHVTVAAEEGQFFGWPANGGAWVWGDEIVVVFKQGKMNIKEKGHLIDRSVPQIDVQARSLDGGKTWTLEKDYQFICNNNTVKKLESPIDFKHENFAFRFQLTGLSGGKSYFFYSYDRCKTWNGPYELPLFGEALVSARTCTLIEGTHEMRAFVSGAPQTGEEFGTHVFLIQTQDGGLNWEKVTDVGLPSQPDQWSIMPSVARISGNELVCALRFHNRNKNISGHEYWGSLDNGKTWQFRSMLPLGSTPPSLEYLNGDRLVVLYGQRNGKTPGISVRLSKDRGKTWGDEIVFRNDGGSFDLGYTRNVFRSDGKGILIYYFTLQNPNADRTIEATLWNPDQIQ
jgi:hypothetical protein